MLEITTRAIALRIVDSTIVFCGLNSVLQIRIIYRENCLIISGKTPPTDNRIVYVSTLPHCRRISRERRQLPQHNCHPQQNLQRGSHPILRCSQSRYGGQPDVYSIFTSVGQSLTSMYSSIVLSQHRRRYSDKQAFDLNGESISRLRCLVHKIIHQWVLFYIDLKSVALILIFIYTCKTPVMINPISVVVNSSPSGVERPKTLLPLRDPAATLAPLHSTTAKSGTTAAPSAGD